MKLQSMTDFVLESESRMNQNILSDLEIIGELRQITVYANFLKQPLTLGMFIPCNQDGIPLQEPKSSLIYKMQVGECSADEMRENREYNQAKEKVLFEGLKYYDRCIHTESETILYIQDENFFTQEESLVNTIEHIIEMHLTLTPNAIKKLGL